MTLLRWIALVTICAGSVSAPQADELRGSIAFSREMDGNFAWGIAWGPDDADRVTVEAIEQCRRQGGTGCQEIGWFPAACGALVLGDDGAFTAGWGVTASDAIADGLARCDTRNDGCREAFTACAQLRQAGGRGSLEDGDLTRGRIVHGSEWADDPDAVCEWTAYSYAASPEGFRETFVATDWERIDAEEEAMELCRGAFDSWPGAGSERHRGSCRLEPSCCATIQEDGRLVCSD